MAMSTQPGITAARPLPLAPAAAAEHAGLAAELARVRAERDALARTVSRLSTLDRMAVFQAGLVHEVGHQVGSMAAAVELLRREANGQVPAAIARRIEDVQAQVDGCRDVTRAMRLVMAGREQPPVPVPLAQPLSTVWRLVQAEAARRGVRAELAQELPGPAVCVLADRVLLERVLLNLCANAFEAMQPAGGGLLQLGWRVDAVPQGPGRVLVTVTDSGPGLGPRQPPAAGLGSEKADGMGVGLHWARLVVEPWGGSLALQDRPAAQGCGAVARLVLPLRAAAGLPH